MARVALLGLGLMGSQIAQNLLSRGNEVHGYNRTPEKAKTLVENGLKFHSTPREAVESADVVITVLTDQNAVSDVALGSGGFLDVMKRGVWIDMSTILSESSTQHANECEKRGIERLDAPVIGGPPRALKGDLLVLVGGKREVFDKHANFLQQLGKRVVYVGSSAAGHKMKLAFNLYLAVLATGFSEAFTFAEKMGINGKDFVDVVNMTHHKNSYTESRGSMVCKKDFSPMFTLDMMRKDLALVEEETLINHITLPVSGAVLTLFTAAINQGLSELDYSSIVLLLQKMNGIGA